jgi:stage V sporulation protein K
LQWIKQHKVLSFIIVFIAISLFSSITTALSAHGIASVFSQLVAILLDWVVFAGIVWLIVTLVRGKLTLRTKSQQQTKSHTTKSSKPRGNRTHQQQDHTHQEDTVTHTYKPPNEEEERYKANVQQPNVKKIRTMDELNARLDSVVGLESVKNTLREIFATAQLEKQRRKQGIQNEEGQSLHMIFSGSPGTGKTTMARIVGEMFAGIGILSKGTFTETNQSGLVGQYVGETPQKTTAVVNQALGGILFVDEAYSLAGDYGSSAKSHGREAVDTLIAEMENHRKDLCVIFAGYENDMKKFIAMNEGMKSRIAFHLEFPDYSPPEMVTITLREAAKRNYKMTRGAADKLYRHYKSINIGKVGNGRYTRNVLEAAIRKFAVRAMSEGVKDLTVLTDQDFDV